MLERSNRNIAATLGFGHRMQLWSRLEVTYLPLPIVSSASPTLPQPFDMRLVKNVYGMLFGLLSVPYVRSNPSYQEPLLYQPSTDSMDESLLENTPAVGMDLTSCYGQVNNFSLYGNELIIVQYCRCGLLEWNESQCRQGSRKRRLRRSHAQIVFGIVSTSDVSAT